MAVAAAVTLGIAAFKLGYEIGRGITHELSQE